MKAHEIKNLSASEIQTKLDEIHEELFNLRFQFAIGQARDPNQMSALKRDIARLKTILRKIELAEL
jgi:large subunit ribosomal protein L29